ncbi:E3 ubiquitin-protein ligase LRSAM1-like [Adelges cooleyi]|uniref:E3 ubiquitin-protein ligase LRSAM1-like n=1 Tax=Adelges cooleyi TaxID=133065 RepID=UPI00217F696F|nr:E3 ubiquitin-protein ligase LRSAM1-like [Adelges cooleyi]
MNFLSLFSKKDKNCPKAKTSTAKSLLLLTSQDLIMQEKLEKLELQKELKKKNLLEAEKTLKEYEENMFQNYRDKQDNDKLINTLLLDEVRTQQIISSARNEREKTREKLLFDLIKVEMSTRKLIDDTLNFNQSFQMDFHEKYSNCEKIVIPDDSCYRNLEKKDNLEFSSKLERILEETDCQRCVRFNKVSEKHTAEMETLTNILNTGNCYRQVLKEQLKSMYNQLKYLTGAELQKQDLQTNKHMTDICQERLTLARLIVDLTDKKKQNQKRLIQILEAQNVATETASKWLFQYSRLVDRLPSDLTYSDERMNPALLHRVSTAGGSHLLLFVLENALQPPLTKQYLTEIGVHSVKDQELLINIINKLPEPSAPPESELPPTAPLIDELECIVCMETPFDVIFIPCGHLCCCWKCSSKLLLCPMCRSDICDKIQTKNYS